MQACFPEQSDCVPTTATRVGGTWPTLAGDTVLSLRLVSRVPVGAVTASPRQPECEAAFRVESLCHLRHR